jgi:hypothetical protein
MQVHRVSQRRHSLQDTSRASIPDTREPLYWNDPTPLHYFERWSLSELSAVARDSIQGRLLQIHGAFLNNEIGEPTHVWCWRKTFDVLAGEFLKAGSLTEQRLITTIPGIVADASASGRWLFGRHSCNCPTDDFSEQVGTEFWSPEFIQDIFRGHLEGTITTWRGRQLSYAAFLAEVTDRPLANPAARIERLQGRDRELEKAMTPTPETPAHPEMAPDIHSEESLVLNVNFINKWIDDEGWTSTNRCSTPMWPGRKIPGTATNPNRRFGRR